MVNEGSMEGSPPVKSAPTRRLGIAAGIPNGIPQYNASGFLNTRQLDPTFQSDGIPKTPTRDAGGPRHKRILSARAPLTASLAQYPAQRATSPRQHPAMIARGVPLLKDASPVPPQSPRDTPGSEFAKGSPVRSYSSRVGSGCRNRKLYESTPRVRASSAVTHRENHPPHREIQAFAPEYPDKLRGGRFLTHTPVTALLSPRNIFAEVVRDGPMNADIGLEETDLRHHHIDAEMAARIGRLVNVYSVGFIRTLATTCAPAHDRRGLLMKVGRLYLDRWSKQLGQEFDSQLVHVEEERAALSAELKDKTTMNSKLEEGLKRMVTMSLERALQDRVGLQEKDLLRSQLEMERQAHRATLTGLDEQHQAAAKLQGDLEDYRALSERAREEMHRQQAEYQREQAGIDTIKMQLELKTLEGKGDNADREQLKGVIDALRAEVGFKEGQCAQVIEDASELVRNAESAASEKESLYNVARKTNSELAWDKGLLLGQVESLKREVGKNKERTTEVGAAKEEAIRLRAELKEVQRTAGMLAAEQSEKEVKLKASLERKTVKKRQWKVKCAEKGETVRVDADAHATEVAALRVKKLEETEYLRSAFEDAKNMYDRQLEGQLAEIHRLRNLLGETSAVNNTMRDHESRHHTQTLEGLREHYATEAARALTQFSKETDRERDRTAKSVAENETLAIRLGRAEAGGAAAKEQILMMKEAERTRVDDRQLITDKNQVLISELAGVNHALTQSQADHAQVRHQLRTVQELEAELRGEVQEMSGRLRAADVEIPRLQTALQKEAQAAQQNKREAAEQSRAAEHAGNEALRAARTLERREDTFAAQLQREQALQASQTEQITTMAAQSSALLAAKQELTVRLEAAWAEFEVKEAASKQQVVVMESKTVKAEGRVLDYQSLVETERTSYDDERQRSVSSTLAVRAELAAAEAALNEKTRSNLKVLEEVEDLRHAVLAAADLNELATADRIKEQRTQATGKVKMEARMHHTDAIPLHPRLKADRSKSLLAASFQRAVALRCQVDHLASSDAPPPRPQGASTNHAALMGVLTQRMADACYLRVLGGVGNVMADAEDQLKTELLEGSKKLEEIVLDKCLAKQDGMLRKMDHAMKQVHRMAAIYAAKMQRYRQSNVALRFRYAVTASKLDYAALQLSTLRQDLRKTQERSDVLGVESRENATKLKEHEKRSRQETDFLQTKLQTAEMKMGELKLEVQATEHRQMSASTNHASQHRRDEQKIGVLNKLLTSELDKLQKAAGEIRQMKQESRQFMDAQLAQYGARLATDLDMVVKRAVESDKRAEQLFVLLERREEKLRQFGNGAARTAHENVLLTLDIEAERAFGPRKILQHMWLGSLDSSHITNQSVNFSLPTLTKLVMEIYCEKIYADVDAIGRKQSVQDMQSFVFDFFMLRFKVQEHARANLFGLLRGLDGLTQTSKRLQMFARFCGCDQMVYMDTGDLTFFLHVFSNVLTKHRQYPKQSLGGVELSHLMSGATDVARNVAVDVAEACLRSCPKQVGQECLAKINNLEAHLNNIKLDQFLEAVMETYLQEKKKALVLATRLFRDIDQKNRGFLTQDVFVDYIVQWSKAPDRRCGKLTMSDAIKIFNSVDSMNTMTFAGVAWKFNLEAFSLQLHVPAKFGPNHPELDHLHGQHATFHQYDQIGLLEESWLGSRRSLLDQTASGAPHTDGEITTTACNNPNLEDEVKALDKLVGDLRQWGGACVDAWRLYHHLISVNHIILLKKQLQQLQGIDGSHFSSQHVGPTSSRSGSLDDADDSSKQLSDQKVDATTSASMRTDMHRSNMKEKAAHLEDMKEKAATIVAKRLEIANGRLERKR